MTSTLSRPTLERLFLNGRISRRQLLTGLAACGLTSTAIDALVGCARTEALQAPPTANFLCLLVLDGFRPDYRHLAPMPALHSLLRNGVTYDRAWVGQVESETPAGHATITTGSMPRHHGVIGFEWRDPDSRREVLDGWDQDPGPGQVGRDIASRGAGSIPLVVKQADPTAQVVALSSEKVYAADAMGANAADYVLYHRYDGKNRLVPAGLPSRTPPADFFSAPNLRRSLPLQHFTDWDDLAAELALAAVRAYRPKALMVNLPGSDVYGHKFAGARAPHIMARVITGQDRAIARIVRAYHDAGILAQTLFVITADHGMAANNHAVSPNQVRAAVKAAGARYLFHTGGTAKYIYLANASLSHAGGVAREMARIPAVQCAFYRAPSGEYVYAAGRLDRELREAYHYLLSTFSGPAAPDVVAPYRENTIGTDWSVAYGNHGGMSWKVQHVPLVISGPGVRRGVESHAPARLVDVAPTILRLLGLRQGASDGFVLADALIQPTAEETAVQTAQDARLRAHRDALSARSEADLRHDAGTGLRPPPLPPATP